MPNVRSNARWGADAGTSLCEVLVSMVLLTTTLAGVAPFIATCVDVIARTRVETGALVSASARIEELSCLRYDQRADSLALETDVATDLADVPASAAGSGLSPGAPDAAWADVSGAVDRLDASWESVASDVAQAVVTRRWAVSNLAAPSGADRLLLHVFARSRAEEQRDGPRRSAQRRPGDAWLFLVRARSLR